MQEGRRDALSSPGEAGEGKAASAGAGGPGGAGGGGLLPPRGLAAALPAPCGAAQDVRWPPRRVCSCAARSEHVLGGRTCALGPRPPLSERDPPAFRPARARVNVPLAPVPNQPPPSGLEPGDPQCAESPRESTPVEARGVAVGSCPPPPKLMGVVGVLPATPETESPAERV